MGQSVGPESAALDKSSASGHKASLTKAQNESRSRIQAFLAKVRGLRGARPGLWLGQFSMWPWSAYTASKKTFSTAWPIEGGQMSLDIQIGPHQVFGLELNP